jgi:hypothetical protein
MPSAIEEMKKEIAAAEEELIRKSDRASTYGYKASNLVLHQDKSLAYYTATCVLNKVKI